VSLTASPVVGVPTRLATVLACAEAGAGTVVSLWVLAAENGEDTWCGSDARAHEMHSEGTPTIHATKHPRQRDLSMSKHTTTKQTDDSCPLPDPCVLVDDGSAHDRALANPRWGPCRFWWCGCR